MDPYLLQFYYLHTHTLCVAQLTYRPPKLARLDNYRIVGLICIQ